MNLFTNLNFIIETIGQTSAIELSEYWGTNTTEKSKISDWIDLVSDYSKRILKQIITELISS